MIRRNTPNSYGVPRTQFAFRELDRLLAAPARRRGRILAGLTVTVAVVVTGAGLMARNDMASTQADADRVARITTDVIAEISSVVGGDVATIDHVKARSAELAVVTANMTDHTALVTHIENSTPDGVTLVDVAYANAPDSDTTETGTRRVTAVAVADSLGVASDWATGLAEDDGISLVEATSASASGGSAVTVILDLAPGVFTMTVADRATLNPADVTLPSDPTGDVEPATEVNDAADIAADNTDSNENVDAPTVDEATDVTETTDVVLGDPETTEDPS